MTTKNKVLRSMIPAVLVLTVLLATACENPTSNDNNNDSNISGDNSPTPPDPHTLVLPAGTVVGWDNDDHADENWHLDWFGLGTGGSNNTFSTFGKLSLQSAHYPGQSIQRSELDGRLRSSSDRGGDNFVFDSSYPAGFISPEVQMLRVAGLYNGWVDDGITRADSSAPDILIEWWYVSANTVVNGTRTFVTGTGATESMTANNVELTEGWNTMIFTKDGTDWTVTTGSEPTGIGWYLGW